MYLKLHCFQLHFAVGVTATNTGANADDVSPAIYNSPNGQKGSTVTGNFSEAEYFTLGADKSNNLSQMNPSDGWSASKTTSIIDAGKYLTLSQSTNDPVLYLHYAITNTSDADQEVHRIVTLPYGLAGNTAFSNLFSRQLSSQVVYGGTTPVQLKLSSNGGSTNDSSFVVQYAYDADYGSSEFLPSHSRQIVDLAIDGTLHGKQTMSIDIPLKIVKNSDDVLTAGPITSVDDIPNNGYSTTSPSAVLVYDTDNQHLYIASMFVLLAQYQNITTTTSNKYLVSYKNADGSYSVANDLESLLPGIKDSHGLSIADFGQDVHTSAANDTYLYSGGQYSVNTDNVIGTNGKNLTTMATENGYKLPSKVLDFSWDYKPSADIAQLMNKNGLGNINIPVIKIIDANDVTIKQGDTWNAKDHVKILDDNGNVVSNPDVKVVSDNVNPNVPANNYKVTYSYKSGDTTFTKTINVTVLGKYNPTPTPNNNGGGSSSTTTPTTNSNSTNNPVGNGNFNNGSTTSQPAVPNYAAVKGSAVYATKGIYMYKNANFKKSQRIAKYPKAKRVNRPMFVVTGYARSTNGTLRYKVRDVNHGKKTANKVGYITANREFVVNVYYKTMPKNKKITVIANKGVNSYKNTNLTKKSKHFKKGTHLTVKKIVKHNLTTRYQLSNGHYVTGNKKLVIQGNY